MLSYDFNASSPLSFPLRSIARNRIRASLILSTFYEVELYS